MSPDDQAAELVRNHGARALQLLVDELVQAVKAGDEARILALDGVLKAAERRLQQCRREQP
ncbi:MAG: hypothetical protein WDN24_14230 [Sphingomonas sp.]